MALKYIINNEFGRNIIWVPAGNYIWGLSNGTACLPPNSLLKCYSLNVFSIVSYIQNTHRRQTAHSSPIRAMYGVFFLIQSMIFIGLSHLSYECSVILYTGSCYTEIWLHTYTYSVSLALCIFIALNSLRPRDAYMRRFSNRHCFR